MSPWEVMSLAKRTSLRPMIEGNKRKLSIPKDDWLALRDYMAQLEPITQWPMPEQKPATRLTVHGVDVVAGNL